MSSHRSVTILFPKSDIIVLKTKQFNFICLFSSYPIVMGFQRINEKQFTNTSVLKISAKAYNYLGKKQKSLSNQKVFSSYFGFITIFNGIVVFMGVRYLIYDQDIMAPTIN